MLCIAEARALLGSALMPFPCLPHRVREDRIERYVAGEPLRLIASDHGVTIPAILHTVRRYAPWALGRPRGGEREVSLRGSEAAM